VLRGESGRIELKNLSTMIKWWSGLFGPNGLTSAPLSYHLMISQLREHTLKGTDIKVIWVQLRNRKGVVTILAFYYRPPNS